MPVITEKFSLNMEGDSEIKNITKEISDILSAIKIKNGTVTIFVKHTTSSLMIFRISGFGLDYFLLSQVEFIFQ